MALDETASQLALTAPAEPRSVPLLRREVEAFLAAQSACPKRVPDIRLAVSEAVANVVLHAYCDTPGAGSIELRAIRRDRSVEVVVCDDGPGLMPRADSPGLGLGMPVIARLTDTLEIGQRGSAPGTAVRMCFDC